MSKRVPTDAPPGLRMTKTVKSATATKYAGCAASR